jgi:hypothetical protein
MKVFLPLIPALLLTAISANGAIIATEVGNNAPGDDSANEYVVVLNTGPTSVDLTGYDITDSLLSWDAIGAITLAAGQSLVISSGADEATLESVWGQSIPNASLFVIVNGLAGFNNGDDSVNLRDGSDSVIYTFDYTGSLGDDDPATAIQLGPTGGSGGSSITPFSTVSTVPEPGAFLLGGLA